LEESATSSVQILFWGFISALYPRLSLVAVLESEGAQGLNRGASGFEVAYPGDHVDDGLAARPGTAVDPTWSTPPSSHGPSTCSRGRPFVSIPRTS
jgi:hypothetical protein